MTLPERAKSLFAQSLETAAHCLPALAEPIALAAQIMVNSMLGGGKLLTCGNGGSAANAQHFTSKLLNRFERERPGLPAICLAADATTLTSIATHTGAGEIFAKQINALGHPGDVLFLITATGVASNLARAIETAQERQMTLILLCGRDEGQLGSMLGQNDLIIPIDSSHSARIQEMHLLIIHCLCELIDIQLLGEP